MRKVDLLFADPLFSVLKIEKQIASKYPWGKYTCLYMRNTI